MTGSKQNGIFAYFLLFIKLKKSAWNSRSHTSDHFVASFSENPFPPRTEHLSAKPSPRDHVVLPSAYSKTAPLDPFLSLLQLDFSAKTPCRIAQHVATTWSEGRESLVISSRTFRCRPVFRDQNQPVSRPGTTFSEMSKRKRSPGIADVLTFRKNKLMCRHCTEARTTDGSSDITSTSVTFFRKLEDIFKNLRKFAPGKGT